MSDETEEENNLETKIEELKREIIITENKLLDQIADNWERGITRQNVLEKADKCKKILLRALTKGNVQGRPITPKVQSAFEETLQILEDYKKWESIRDPDERYLVRALMRRMNQSNKRSPRPNKSSKISIEDVKKQIPKKLRKMLTFEEDEDYLEIRVLQFLGSENFAKIAGILRTFRDTAVYVSEDGCFRIPLT